MVEKKERGMGMGVGGVGVTERRVALDGGDDDDDARDDESGVLEMRRVRRWGEEAVALVRRAAILNGL